MKFRKIRKSPETISFTFEDAMGNKTTVMVGDVDFDTGRVITKQDISILINLHNREIYNNNKHAKPPVKDQMKAQIAEWEEAHGEKYCGHYNASLDGFFGEKDEMDNSQLLLEAYESTHHEESAEVDKLHEVIEGMSEVQRQALVLVKLKGMKVKEVAEELGKSEAAISRAVDRAMEYIKKNY